MAYGEAGWSRTYWAGYASSDFHPPNQVLPPPIPGGSGPYFYSSGNGMYPWSYVGWAMGTPQLPLEYGGVVAVPHQDIGAMALHVWWPNTTVLHVIRIHDDGSRHPVRGAYGLTITGSTRINYALNPGFEAGLNGVVTDAGTPTLTRIKMDTDPTVPFGQYMMRATVAGAGSNGVTIPTSYTGALPLTVGFQLRVSARPTAVRVLITWTDGGGSPLSSTTATLAAGDVNNSVAQFARQVAQITPPATAVTPTVKIIADGMPAGGSMDLDGITIERTGNGTSASQFDGASLGGSWLATPHLSASQLAPVQTIYDGECPLDVPVTYIAANPELTGGQVESSSVSLPSSGRYCWLTHPLKAQESPLRVDLRSVPVLEHGIEQGVFYPAGARRALVVSSRRRSPSAELTFNANSFTERDEFLDYASDGMPLLLRAPARYGYGYGTWWALGAIAEDREGRLAYQDAMILVSQATSTYEPSPALFFQEI